MRLPVLTLKIGLDNKSTESKMPKHEPASYLPALQAVNCVPRQIEIFLNRSERALFVNFEIRKLPVVLLQQFLQTQIRFRGTFMCGYIINRFAPDLLGVKLDRK